MFLNPQAKVLYVGSFISGQKPLRGSFFLYYGQALRSVPIGLLEQLVFLSLR